MQTFYSMVSMGWQEIALLVFFSVGILRVGKNQMCYLCVGSSFQFST